MERWDELSRFLTGRGFPGHGEPRTLPPYPQRSTLQSFPSRYLHLLRRAYVYHRNSSPLTVLPEGSTVAGDPALRAEYDQPQLTSHLVHHSDTVGFYVPLDFPRPLTAGPGESVLGGTVGSSVRLRREPAVLNSVPRLSCGVSRSTTPIRRACPRSGARPSA